MYKKNEIKRNCQLYRCYLINLCSAFFLGFLFYEMLFLLFKLLNYNLEKCIMSEFNIGKLNISSNLEKIRNQCWIYGIQREYVQMGFRNGDVRDFGYGPVYHDKSVLRLEFIERANLQMIVYLSFIVILIQIVAYYLQKRFNYFLPIIQRLKERSIVDFNIADRQFISNQLEKILDKPKSYFWFVILLKLINFVLLIVIICIYKFILLGQFTDLTVDLFDYEFWLNLIQFPSIDKLNQTITDENASKNIIQHNESDLSNILNQIFFVLWLSFIIIFIIYIVLVLSRLIEYMIPYSRTKTILSFIPNCDPELISTLNQDIRNYFLLHKIGRNISTFHFNLLIETVFYVKDDEIQIDEEEIEDEQTNYIRETDGKEEKINLKKNNDEQLINVNLDNEKIENRERNEQHFIKNENYDDKALQQTDYTTIQVKQQTNHFRLSNNKNNNEQNASKSTNSDRLNNQQVKVDIENDNS